METGHVATINTFSMSSLFHNSFVFKANIIPFNREQT